MKYKIDKSQGAAYLQIYKQLRADIIAGVYPYGSRLPSKRLLSEELGVSTVTVEHAYALLSDEGYVEPRERSGFFVVFLHADGFAASAEVIRSCVSGVRVSHTNPDFPFSVLAKTMRRVLTDYGEAILEKPANKGCIQLREALVLYLARNRGMNVDTEQIIIGSGAEYLYGLIIALLGRSRVYGIEAPSYKKIQEVYSASETVYELLPLANDGIDSAALSKTKASVLHTTPYGSYPTGISASASKLHECIRWSGKNGRIIIEDDFESEFWVSTKSKDTLFSLSDYDNVIYLNTFSKTVSPSLRIGYMVLPRSLVNQFENKLGFYSCTVPTFEQLVLAELISGGDFERHINRVRRRKRREREKNI